MTRFSLSHAALAAAVAMFTLVAPAQAQATRTWVSGVGDDVNPCSRTAPCKTFAGAISKTAAGGEISVLDPGGFGAVTITKSISIVADGAEGSILGSMTNGIIINAGPKDVVNLHGLFIEGAGNGLSGIKFVAGGELHVRHCLIRGFQDSATGIGIDIQPTVKASIFVSDTTIAKNNVGIRVKPAAEGGAAADVFLDRVEAVQNLNAGITADGASAMVRLNGSTIVGNGAGLASSNGGQIVSYGNNAIAANGAGGNQNGAPTGKLTLQ
jgi:hypothetical protein